VRRRPDFRHQPIADHLRTTPGSWGEVGNYVWRGAAKSAAYNIRNGRLPAYQPAGHFDAEIRLDDEGDPHVYARYIPEGAAR
jgi:hypothetical protein